MTHEQAKMLSEIKENHGELRRIPEESAIGCQVLSHCVSESHVFQCQECLCVFAVEPDGECSMWVPG